MIDQLRSELEQLEHCNHYLANNCRKKDPVFDQQQISLRNEKAKAKARKKRVFEIRNKDIRNRPATLYETLMVKSSASGDQIKLHYHKRSLLTYPDIGNETLFKIINQAYQFQTNDKERDAYNIFGLEEEEKFLNDEN